MKRASLLLLFAAGGAWAATNSVTATGSCPADPAGVENAVAASGPGDTVLLLPGPKGEAFDFSCVPTPDGLTVSVQDTPGITIAGIPGSTSIRGPGMKSSDAVAIDIQIDDTTIRDLDFRGFTWGIGLDPPHLVGDDGPSRVTISGCTFEDNDLGIGSHFPTDHLTITGNTFNVPKPNLNPFGTFANAIVIKSGNSDLLVEDNVFSGPGTTGKLRSLSQLLPNTTDTSGWFQTAGLFQIERQRPAAVRGRISRNSFRGLDMGMQSSSDDADITRNTATGCGLGIVISNDTDDGVTRVTGNIVAGNSATQNAVGITVASGTANLVAGNDFSSNKLAGLLLDTNPGGAPSSGNTVVANTGPVVAIGGSK
jgi:parallel beta-helix repeat protein